MYGQFMFVWNIEQTYNEVNLYLKSPPKICGDIIWVELLWLGQGDGNEAVHLFVRL